MFTPNNKHRALVTPAKRGKGNKRKTSAEPQDQTPAERRAAMTWAQRLKRVFNIDIETCTECGGSVKVAALERPEGSALGVHPCARSIRASMHIIACIEDPVVIKKILTHRMGKALSAEPVRLPESRVPPQAGLFD